MVFAGKSLYLLPRKPRLIKSCQRDSKRATFCPRLSFACPVKRRFTRATLARGQPGSNWGRPTHFSRKVGVKVGVGRAKNSSLSRHSKNDEFLEPQFEPGKCQIQTLCLCSGAVSPPWAADRPLRAYRETAPLVCGYPKV